MIKDHTTGLLKYRFNGVLRNVVRHWPPGFDIADVQRPSCPKRPCSLTELKSVPADFVAMAESSCTSVD